MADVFISYKSERRAAAEHLADILEDHGYSVWFDYALATGDSFSEQIGRELEAASCVVVLWCSLSVDSKWVKREASFAQDRGKICPAFIERIELPFPFHHEQTISLLSWNGEPKPGEPRPLLAEVAKHTGKAPKPDVELLRRAEKAWRRFGSQPLAKFALGHGVRAQEGEPDFASAPIDSRSTSLTLNTEHPLPKTGADAPEDTPSAQVWAKLKAAQDLEGFDDFLRIFPDAIEADECRAARAQLIERRSAETLAKARQEEFASLPRDGYELAPFDAFITAHPGTYEAFAAARLRRECEARITAAAPTEEETREQWELDTPVAILTGQPVPPERRPHIRKLSLSGGDNELLFALKAANAWLDAIYEDPDAEEYERVIRLSDLTPLQSLSSLQHLDLNRTRVRDLTSLKYLSDLQSLDLSSTQVRDLTPLQSLLSLQSLYLGGTQVSDLSPLQSLSSLRELSLSNTQISDLTPLQSLSSLQTLYLSRTQVRDLSPLQSLSSLKTLTLRSTQVRDLRPLRSLSSLQTLNLSSTQVRNLRPLQSLSPRQTLYLRNTPVTDWSPVDHIDRVFGRPKNWNRKS